MPRFRLSSIVFLATVALAVGKSALADDPAANIGQGLIQQAAGEQPSGPRLLPTAPSARKLVPARRVSNIADAAKLPLSVEEANTPKNPVPYTTIPPGPGAGHGYVKLDAPLYPTPVPWVPYQVGGTFITNQAFSPHEMLWAHKYKALYPPFYYKVRGGWFLTPRGIWSNEVWELKGTEVEIKYSSQKPLFR